MSSFHYTGSKRLISASSLRKRMDGFGVYTDTYAYMWWRRLSDLRQLADRCVGAHTLSPESSQISSYGVGAFIIRKSYLWIIYGSLSTYLEHMCPCHHLYYHINIKTQTSPASDLYPQIVLLPHLPIPALLRISDRLLFTFCGLY